MFAKPVERRYLKKVHIHAGLIVVWPKDFMNNTFYIEKNIYHKIIVRFSNQSDFKNTRIEQPQRPWRHEEARNVEHDFWQA